MADSPLARYDAQVSFGPFVMGLWDKGDASECPDKAVFSTLGFEYSSGFPQTERGREQYTGPALATLSAAQRVRSPVRWRDPTATVKSLWYADGALWIGDEPDGSTGDTINTVCSTIDVGGATATMSGGTSVVVTVGTIHCQKTLAATTDKFYFVADGRAARKQINSLLSETSFTVAAYTGATAGAFTIERTIGETNELAVCDGRVWMTDHVLRPHYYGPQSTGSTVSIFREAGLPVPATPPTVTLAQTGVLDTGTYYYKCAYEDARGVIGNPLSLAPVSSTGNMKAAFTSMPAAPHWVTKYRVYRSRVNSLSTSCYHIARDYPELLLSAGTTDGTTSTFTLASGQPNLVANEHKHRTVTFRSSTKSWTVASNATNSFTINADAVSQSATKESTTDYVSILGGFNLSSVQGSTITDVVGDTNLDYDQPAPTDNDQPPAGACFITPFRNDGRLAVTDGKSRVHFSGRPATSKRSTGEDISGDGVNPVDLECWPCFHDIKGNDKVPIVRPWEMGGDLYAGREDGIFELDCPSSEVTGWKFIQRADNVGLLAPKSIGKMGHACFFLGTRAGEVDIVWFDGITARSIGRPVLKTSLDEIVSFQNAVGTVFRGKYYLSYTITGQTSNTRTLRYYIQERIFDKQPWGCGEFLEPYSTGSTFYLYCCAPTAVGHIYRVLGSSSDLGAVIQRQLITGKRSIAPCGPKVRWHLLHVDLKGG